MIAKCMYSLHNEDGKFAKECNEDVINKHMGEEASKRKF